MMLSVSYFMAVTIMVLKFKCLKWQAAALVKIVRRYVVDISLRNEIKKHSLSMFLVVDAPFAQTKQQSVTSLLTNP